jgi:hypothetical protein
VRLPQEVLALEPGPVIAERLREARIRAIDAVRQA